jgi:tRNA 2-thiouridine synthesizing protein A
MTTTINETELETITADKIIDARGAACPGPLLEAKKGMATVPVGGVVEVWSSDPVTKSDIGAWAAKVGHGFMGHLTAQGYERVFVRRGK